MTLEQIEELLASWSEPKFRAGQVYRQLYVNLARRPEYMTDLSKDLRSKLLEETRMETLRFDKVLTCDKDMTKKALFHLPDGNPGECVLMVYKDRATVCVSSQSGCPMACAFCATGKLGFLCDLTPGQMIEQVLWAERELRGMGRKVGTGAQPTQKNRFPRLLSNIVFMGMGEPFNNYDQWWEAVERLHDPDGFNMGARGFTVSTVGLIPGIDRLADAPYAINLAVSLHAPNDELRFDMMPVNKRYPIADLIDSVRSYTGKTGRRVSFEYILLQEKNDTPELARQLAGLLTNPDGSHLLCHVNLIPWNHVPGTPLERSQRARVDIFQKELSNAGIPCTVRIERGTEIGAACGQLAGANAG
ncbi:MAG: 23S rRNA (adenine(2503)-C(2))-methyltransferase RlmN [Verrucomicrobia bacterium]|nr:23S rRNA (adenine(2503)-C(2))-methyltransferase RlmN [Verrucomicrobiota bacterium]